MNRYPIWKYAILAVTLAFGLIYTLPNFFGESPAVQVSSGKATIKIDTGMLARVESVLQKAQLKSTGLQFEMCIRDSSQDGEADSRFRATT